MKLGTDMWQSTSQYDTCWAESKDHRMFPPSWPETVLHAQLLYRPCDGNGEYAIKNVSLDCWNGIGALDELCANIPGKD